MSVCSFRRVQTSWYLFHPLALSLSHTRTLSWNAIKVLDATQSQDTLRIGVLHVKQGQATELEILRNTSGSLGYLGFLDTLGEVGQHCLPAMARCV